MPIVLWRRPLSLCLWRGWWSESYHVVSWPTCKVSCSINPSFPGENGRHFADDIFAHILLNGNARISIKISLKFVPEGPIYNRSALVEVMVWRRYSHWENMNIWEMRFHLCVYWIKLLIMNSNWIDSQEIRKPIRVLLPLKLMQLWFWFPMSS